MGFGLHGCMTDEERAELARRVMAMRNNFAGLVELVERVATRAGLQGEAAEAAAVLRQMSAAVDVALVVPQGPERVGEALEAGRELASKIVGPNFDAPPRTDRAPDAGEEWSDTLGGE